MVEINVFGSSQKSPDAVDSRRHVQGIAEGLKHLKKYKETKQSKFNTITITLPLTNTVFENIKAASDDKFFLLYLSNHPKSTV